MHRLRRRYSRGAGPLLRVRLPGSERIGSQGEAARSVCGRHSGGLNLYRRGRAGSQRRRVLPASRPAGGVRPEGSVAVRESGKGGGAGGARSPGSRSELGYGGVDAPPGGKLSGSCAGEESLIRYFAFCFLICWTMRAAVRFNTLAVVCPGFSYPDHITARDFKSTRKIV